MTEVQMTMFPDDELKRGDVQEWVERMMTTLTDATTKELAAESKGGLTPEQCYGALVRLSQQGKVERTEEKRKRADVWQVRRVSWWRKLFGRT